MAAFLDGDGSSLSGSAGESVFDDPAAELPPFAGEAVADESARAFAFGVDCLSSRPAIVGGESLAPASGSSELDD